MDNAQNGYSSVDDTGKILKMSIFKGHGPCQSLVFQRFFIYSDKKYFYSGQKKKFLGFPPDISMITHTRI